MKEQTDGQFCRYQVAKWLKQCERQLREMVTDPDQAHFIQQELDKDSELREELSAIYVRAIRTLEPSGRKV